MFSRCFRDKGTRVRLREASGVLHSIGGYCVTILVTICSSTWGADVGVQGTKQLKTKQVVGSQ